MSRNFYLHLNSMVVVKNPTPKTNHFGFLQHNLISEKTINFAIAELLKENNFIERFSSDNTASADKVDLADKESPYHILSYFIQIGKSVSSEDINDSNLVSLLPHITKHSNKHCLYFKIHASNIIYSKRITRTALITPQISEETSAKLYQQKIDENEERLVEFIKYVKFLINNQATKYNIDISDTYELGFDINLDRNNLLDKEYEFIMTYTDENITHLFNGLKLMSCDIISDIRM